MRRHRIGLLGLMLAAAAAAAQPSASGLSFGAARLLSIGEDAAGAHAVIIEASEPVAYAVSRPDPFTVLVDLRDVRAGDAKNRFRPSPAAPVSAIVIDEMRAPDGVPLTRVMMQLKQPLQHTATANKGKIRIAFEGVMGSTGSTGSTRSTGSVPAATVLGSLSAAGSGSLTRVTLSGNGWVAPSGLDELADGSIVIDLPGVTSAPALGGAAQGIVAGVRADLQSREPLVTRVTIDLVKRAAFRVERAGRDGADYVVVFDERAPLAPGADHPFGPDEIEDPDAAAKTSDFAAAAGSAAIDPMSALRMQQAAAPPVRQTPPEPPAVQAPALPTQPAPRQYQGIPISLDLQGSPLRDVLRLFANISGLNMVIDAAIEGSVDIILTDVPWDQALEIILRAHNLDYTLDGTVVRIAKRDTLRQEEEQRASLEKARAEAGELIVKTYALSYASAATISEMLKAGDIISDRGQTVVDERTNTLIITDLGARHQTAEQLIRGLDRPEPQVEIEARIVQTTRDFARSIGIQWGLNGRVSPDIGNTTGLAFPNNGSLGGRVGGLQGPIDVRGNPSADTGTAVDLRVPGATNAIGISLGAINGAFNLDVALSALERSGKGRILSTPRVTTQNNNPAEMYQGIQIPIQTIANNTVTVTFKDAALSLRVTPQVTTAGTVIMQIQLENATADFSRQVNGIPPIDTQRAMTRVQIDDGATTVIGGIFVSREQSTQGRTPVLHRIPLFGWLFKRDEIQDESRELLIFITPRVLRS
ncbi:MAG TPA: type IV pilus secretin PilQ [Vicinamibacterales bacterium]|nr:type IV pilus secretin PilQ [Vicinamibacterales bacterium]